MPMLTTKLQYLSLLIYKHVCLIGLISVYLNEATKRKRRISSEDDEDDDDQKRKRKRTRKTKEAKSKSQHQVKRAGG